MKILRTDLAPLEKIAAGGFGCVYKAPDFTLPGDPAPVAYKEFTTDIGEQAARASNAVAFWKQLDAGEQADLAEYLAWPRELVYEGSSVCGLLMPLLPDDFFCGQRSPQSMKWLISTEAQRRAAGVDTAPVDRADRYSLLGKLAYALARLHRHGWVYGTLGFDNVAFAVGPPRIRLLDCDAAAPLSDQRRRQAHTPFWAPPECEADDTRLQDERTDVYQLGLMILRCLTPGRGSATTTDSARLRGTLGGSTLALVARALDVDPSQRPTAAELCLEFQWLARRGTSLREAA